MPAILATGKDLKKVSIFIDKYGNKHEGNFFENAQKTNGTNLGRPGTTEGIPTQTGGDKTEENK